MRVVIEQFQLAGGLFDELAMGTGGLLFQFQQFPARAVDHVRRHAGQFRHLQAVTLVGGAGFKAVHENNAVAVFNRIQVHIGDAVDFIHQ